MEIVSLGPLWKRVGKWLGCIVPILLRYVHL